MMSFFTLTLQDVTKSEQRRAAADASLADGSLEVVFWWMRYRLDLSDPVAQHLLAPS
jgi:hypothetical protein